ncbi:MAG: zinc-ribbon domain-containing protein [Oscillospiraceae bacterium]|nr:zinc-ribbon domain-containing protein [Oscillospiraceae bacterium]
MFCPKCGAQLEVGARFCRHYGHIAERQTAAQANMANKKLTKRLMVTLSIILRKHQQYIIRSIYETSNHFNYDCFNIGLDGWMQLKILQKFPIRLMIHFK